MNESTSTRHESDLGGVLSPFGAAKHFGVTVEVAPAHARSASVQHAAWMLVNLLCRLKGILSQVSIRCPKGIPVARRVMPLGSQELDLHDLLVAGAREIGAVPVGQDVRLDRSIAIGADTPVVGVEWYLWANGWCGGISHHPLPFSKPEEESQLPFGAYIAACVAVGEVFKAARLKKYEPIGSLFYSLWEHRVDRSPLLSGPARIDANIDAALAGVGAVGCAFLHTIWSCPGLKGQIVLADNDSAGVDWTNLNRYVLFGEKSVGAQKATKAAEILADSPVLWLPHDKPFEEIYPAPNFVISAVDKNISRIAIQNRFPARIFSASTLNLRAEVLRCGPPGLGACLACGNPPEIRESDEEVRKRAKELPEDELKKVSLEHAISLADAKEWIKTGKCGTAGEPLLRYLRVEGGDHPFAVGFVSVMAGTMLAAEVIKEHIRHDTPLSESKQRSLFQFLTPFARTNRASEYPRIGECPVCNPHSPSFPIWQQRYRSYSSSQTIASP